MSQKTYQVTVNEREAEILRDHVDATVREIDYHLKTDTFRQGQDKETAIEHIDVLNRVSKQLPSAE